MTLAEWRANKRRVRSARDVLMSPLFTEMLEILRRSAPLYLQSRNLGYGSGVTPQDHSRMLGLCEGYALALDYLQSMGTLPPEPPSDILPSFVKPEQIQ